MTADRRWRGAEIKAKLEHNIRQALVRSAIIAQQEIKRQLNKNSSPSAAGSPPGKDTGELGRSIQIDISKLNDRRFPEVRVGPDLIRVPYARVQEFGSDGPITPKTTKYLPVPLNKAAKNMRRGLKSIRSLNLTLFVRGKKLFLGKGKGKTARFLFVLVKSVTLKARPYIKPALKIARPKIAKEFSKDKLMRGIH